MVIWKVKGVIPKSDIYNGSFFDNRYCVSFLRTSIFLHSSSFFFYQKYSMDGHGLFSFVYYESLRSLLISLNLFLVVRFGAPAGAETQTKYGVYKRSTTQKVTRKWTGKIHTICFFFALAFTIPTHPLRFCF